MYSIEGRVRYTEIGMDKQLTLGGLVDYFQDCSTFETEDIGRGIDYLNEEHRAWLLSSWQLEIDRLPEFGEKFICGTWPYDFHSFYGYRNFVIRDKNGDDIVKANSIWFFADSQTGKPTKLDEEHMKAYVLQPKLEMEYLPRRIKVDMELEEIDSFKIMQYHIDTNNHVNNGQYVRMAAGYLPKDFDVKKMQAEYKNAAHLGDEIIVKKGYNDGVCIVALCNNEGTAYAVVRFEKF